MPAARRAAAGGRQCRGRLARSGAVQHSQHPEHVRAAPALPMDALSDDDDYACREPQVRRDSRLLLCFRRALFLFTS